MIKNLKSTKENFSEKQKIITLQADLVQCKDEENQKIGAVLHESLEDSLKEFRPFSKIVQSQAGASQTAISPAALEKVVNTVVQEENRAKNVMIFGFEQSSTEGLLERVKELFLKLEEQPKIEVQRIGKLKSWTDRPVKVKLRNGAVIGELLEKGVETEEF